MRLFGIFLRTGGALASQIETIVKALGGEPIHQNIRYFSTFDLMKFTGVFVEQKDEELTDVERSLVTAYTDKGATVFFISSMADEKAKDLDITLYVPNAPKTVTATFARTLLGTPAKLAAELQEVWDEHLKTVVVEEPAAAEQTGEQSGDAGDGSGTRTAAEIFEEMTVADLRDLAKDKGVEVSSKANKATVIQALLDAGITA